MRRRVSGFTLIELVVATAVFAVISVAAVTTVISTIETRDRVREQSTRLQALERTFLIMRQDFTQASARTIRDRFGDRRPAMLLEVETLELTRSGYVNPLNRPRSTLQRVAYFTEENVLIRRHWQALDQPHDPQTSDAPLLEGVEDVGFRFLDQNREWLEIWPPAGEEGLPRAVEITLELEDYGEIRRLFLVPF